MATAGIVTFATSGAVATGTAAANPGIVVAEVEERSGLRLPPVTQRRIEVEAKATTPTVPPLPTTREDVRLARDHREGTDREAPVSRSGERGSGAAEGALSDVPTIESLVERPTAVTGGAQKAVLRYLQDDVTVYAAYGKRAKELGHLELGRAVYYTQRDEEGRQEIVLEGNPVWIPTGHLGRTKPEPPPEPTPTPTPAPEPTPDAPAGLDFSACGDPAVEDGLVQDAVDLYRAVCNAFPAVASGTTYGYDPHGEHIDGRALDFMTDDKELGDAVAAFVQEHAAALKVYDIIWYQRIWTPVRADEGWRLMEDRGDPTANHYDHVHIAVN